MVSECGRCGARLDVQRARGPVRYCSNACRQAAYRSRQPKIPVEMRERDRWVSWKLVARAARLTKLPVQLDGTVASSTDPATWTSYRQVKRLPRRGFVLGEGIGCLDLDHCLVDGKPTVATLLILAQLPPTYIEVSPSGDGLHVFGFLPEGPGTRRVVDGVSVESYSVGRYMTVTGAAFKGSTSRLADLSQVALT